MRPMDTFISNITVRNATVETRNDPVTGSDSRRSEENEG